MRAGSLAQFVKSEGMLRIGLQNTRQIISEHQPVPGPARFWNRNDKVAVPFIRKPHSLFEAVLAQPKVQA
jgi:hypothetical protein